MLCSSIILSLIMNFTKFIATLACLQSTKVHSVPRTWLTFTGRLYIYQNMGQSVFGELLNLLLVCMLLLPCNSEKPIISTGNKSSTKKRNKVGITGASQICMCFPHQVAYFDNDMEDLVTSHNEEKNRLIFTMRFTGFWPGVV